MLHPTLGSPSYGLLPHDAACARSQASSRRATPRQVCIEAIPDGLDASGRSRHGGRCRELMRRKRIALLGDSGSFHLEAFSVDETATAAACLVLPGADCAAERYRWLAEAFTPLGVETCIVDPPVSTRESLLQPGTVTSGQIAGPDHLQTALAWLAGCRPGLPVTLVGHSLGGVVIMEWLDQAAARCNPLNAMVHWHFELSEHVVAAVTMGSTLQRQTMGITFPWRSDDAPLKCPGRLPLLMLAGEHDALVTPDLVLATSQRYQPLPSVRTLPDVCHFGWVEGRAPTDRIDLDGKSNLSKSEQQTQSASAIHEFLRPILARVCVPTATPE